MYEEVSKVTISNLLQSSESLIRRIGEYIKSKILKLIPLDDYPTMQMTGCLKVLLKQTKSSKQYYYITGEIREGHILNVHQMTCYNHCLIGDNKNDILFF